MGSAGAVRRAPGWDVSQGRRPGAGPAVPLRGAALTVAQLQTFLQRARTDRFFALWVLEATSGMRRCELAGARRDLLDLAAGTLEIDVTRVVVDGQVIESDGKTENAQHLLALDPFTLAALKAHVEMLDRERKDHGPDYRDHGVLFCWEDGTMHSLPGSRLRRPPLQPSEFVPPACFDSIAGPRVAPDHSAHIPDLGRPQPPTFR